jgi:hypothetical protein
MRTGHLLDELVVEGGDVGQAQKRAASSGVHSASIRTFMESSAGLTGMTGAGSA